MVAHDCLIDELGVVTAGHAAHPAGAAARGEDGVLPGPTPQTASNYSVARRENTSALPGKRPPHRRLSTPGALKATRAALILLHRENDWTIGRSLSACDLASAVSGSD